MNAWTAEVFLGFGSTLTVLGSPEGGCLGDLRV